MTLSYILNLIRNKKILLTSIFGTSVSWMIELASGKGWYLVADQVKVTASKSEQEIAAENGIWLTHPSYFKCKHKTNSGSVLTVRKHIKIVRLGDGCFNWKNPRKIREAWQVCIQHTSVWPNSILIVHRTQKK